MGKTEEQNLENNSNDEIFDHKAKQKFKKSKKRKREDDDEEPTNVEKRKKNVGNEGYNRETINTPIDPTFNKSRKEEEKKRSDHEDSNIDIKCEKVDAVTLLGSNEQIFSLAKIQEIFSIAAYLSDEADSDIEPVNEDDRADICKANQFVKDLVVILPWEVHPLHRVERRVARQPLQSERVLMKALDLKTKTGYFTFKEDEIIKANWKYFCKLHDLTDAHLPFFLKMGRGKKTQEHLQTRLNFVRFLGHNLSDRVLYSIYERFRRLYMNKKLGRYTKAEDRFLIEFIKTTDLTHPYSKLALLLNRNKLSIMRRAQMLAQELTMGDDLKRFSIDKVDALISAVLTATETADILDLKYKNISDTIWRKVGNLMKMKYRNIRNVWNTTVHTRIFIEADISRAAIRRKIIDCVSALNIDDFTEIQWNDVHKEIRMEFDGITKNMVQSIFYGMIVSYYRKLKKDRIEAKECLEILQKTNFPDNWIKKLNV